MAQPTCPVPRASLTSLMCTQGSVNSKAVLVQPHCNHGGKSLFARWIQEECGGEGNLSFSSCGEHESKKLKTLILVSLGAVF